MTEWTLNCWNGQKYVLPHPIDWQLEYGLGAPCDSFRVLCPLAAGQETILADAARLTVKQGNETVFTGVVDECECIWQESGCVLEIIGRGMQALLLDNEASGADYGIATLADILRNYVTPYGISLAGQANLPAVSGFSVQTGSSCWQALYQFARYYGGVTPRFDRQGRLLLSGLDSTARFRLDDTVSVKKLVLRDKRYGVLSQVRVMNRVTLASQTLINESFRKQGGCASRVMTVPRNTGYQAMRFSGQFQLDKSKAELRRLEITVAETFPAWPGELITISRRGWSIGGTYRVLESCVRLNQDGYATTLVLGAPDAVL